MRLVLALASFGLLAAGCRPDASNPADRPTADDKAETSESAATPAEDVPETYRLPGVAAERPASDSGGMWTVAPDSSAPLEQPTVALDEAAADAPFSDEYVYAYLDAASQNDVDAMLDQYADRVRYYDWGVVGHDRIRADKEQYTQRWPRRAFVLVKDPELAVRGAMATVRLDYTFEAAGEGRKRTGTAWTTLTYAFDGREWKIVEERGGTR